MRITRWCVIEARPAAGLQALGTQVQVRFPFDDGRELLEVELDHGGLRALQAMPGVTVLPGLSAPADDQHLPAGVKTWFNGHGVSAGQGDTVLNLLRRLRDAKGASFDVDLPY